MSKEGHRRSEHRACTSIWQQSVTSTIWGRRQFTLCRTCDALEYWEIMDLETGNVGLKLETGNVGLKLEIMAHLAVLQRLFVLSDVSSFHLGAILSCSFVTHES